MRRTSTILLTFRVLDTKGVRAAMSRFIDVDLSVLDYCREDCGDPSLHAAHGPRAASVTVQPATETVFVGPVVAYRCDDCGTETPTAVGRRRPHCGYCRARSSRVQATGFAPGAAVCRGGDVHGAYLTDGDSRRATKAPCPVCGRTVEITRSGHTRAHRPTEVDVVVDPVLTDVVFRAIGHNVPLPFSDIHDAALHTYSGKLSERSTQRALALLMTARQVASIADASWEPARQRTRAVPGWYIRYDSPKLWTRAGLRDLMSVVAQADDDRAVTHAALSLQRAHAVRDRETGGHPHLVHGFPIPSRTQRALRAPDGYASPAHAARAHRRRAVA